jgi:hypothetical protein
MLQLLSSTRRTNHMIWTSRKTWARSLFYCSADSYHKDSHIHEA